VTRWRLQLLGNVCHVSGAAPRASALYQRLFRCTSNTECMHTVQYDAGVCVQEHAEPTRRPSLDAGVAVRRPHCLDTSTSGGFPIEVCVAGTRHDTSCCAGHRSAAAQQVSSARRKVQCLHVPPSTSIFNPSRVSVTTQFNNMKSASAVHKRTLLARRTNQGVRSLLEPAASARRRAHRARPSAAAPLPPPKRTASSPPGDVIAGQWSR